MMNTKTAVLSNAATIDTARMSAIFTVFFGIALLFVVGFLQVSAVHNGAHDTRHANGFPCH
jgi:cobalt transporter subunit CbtB